MKYLRRNKICFPPQAQFSRYLESVFVFVCVVCYFILYLYFIYPSHIYRHTLLLHIYPSPLWTLLHLHPLYILLPFFRFLYCVCLPCCKITKRLLFFKVRNFVVKRFVSQVTIVLCVVVTWSFIFFLLLNFYLFFVLWLIYLLKKIVAEDSEVRRALHNHSVNFVFVGLKSSIVCCKIYHYHVCFALKKSKSLLIFYSLC